MTKSAGTIFSASMQPIRRLMFILGIVPYFNPTINKQCLSYLVVISLHLIAVFALTGFLSHEHLKRMDEAIYNLDDIFSSIMDVLGFGSLILVQLIIQLESAWKLSTYPKIFQKFEQLRTLLLQKFSIDFNFSKLKLLVSILQIYFIIYAGTLLCFVMMMVFQSVPTMRLVISLYAEFVLKVKFFEFIFFVIVFMVMLCDVCRAACMQCRLVEATRFEDQIQRQECFRRFIVLQDLHALLWENVQLITDYFDWSLPGLCVKQLIDLTLLAYWGFLNIEKGTSAVARYYLTVNWFMQIFTLAIACFICSICERWDRNLRSCFNKISKDRQNIFLMRCLHRISMQLWQEPIRFEAGHFVTVNMATLGKYFFSIIMYIVILIQFHM